MKELFRQTQFSERKTNRQTKMSAAEETARLHASWQLMDFLIWLTAYGSQEELKTWTATTEKFRLNATKTAILFTDQIPVWLNVEAGVQLTSANKLARRRKQQAARRDCRKAAKSKAAPDALTASLAASSEGYLTRGPGDPGASRYRITYCARQAVEGLFDSSQTPTGHLMN